MTTNGIQDVTVNNTDNDIGINNNFEDQNNKNEINKYHEHSNSHSKDTTRDWYI